MNTTKHLNDSHNKPLCQKTDWIEVGDSLISGDNAIEENNCKECRRLYLKAKRVGRDKSNTYLQAMRELVTVWADEIDEMTDNGIEPHHWMTYPKTQAKIKETPLPNRQKFEFFINDLLAAIEPTFCKHENLNIDEDKHRETCKDCKYYRNWYFKTVDEDDYGMGGRQEKWYATWTLPDEKKET